MIDQLKRRYFQMLLPAAVGAALLAAARAFRLTDPLPARPLPFLEPTLFFLAVLLAAAAPVMVRAVFAHGVRNRKTTPEKDFLRFQKQMLHVALLTPYVALAACLIDAVRFFHAGIFLAALYAAYYSFPSKRRIDFDRRIFRVETDRC